jgi:hypothetical protein
MPKSKKLESQSTAKTSAVKRAGGAIARTARKLTTKLNPRKRAAASTAKPAAAKAAKTPGKAAKGRATKRQSDVSLDAMANAYTPKQTSLKASFRSDGADQQLDQEVPLGGGDRWQDEDHFTNKSGDSRIGTHGRSYEPGEQRASSENNNRR